jgi:hypothetical protein
MYISIYVKFFIFVVIALIIFTLLVSLFQDSFIFVGMYRDSKYLFKKPFEKIEGSYYKQGSSDELFVVCGGNDSLPQDYVKTALGSEHSFLLICYPNYYKNIGGIPSGTLNLNLESSGIQQILEEFEPPNPYNTYSEIHRCLRKKAYKYKNKITFLCYSIGCAIGLNYLSNSYFSKYTNKIILLAPFYSLEEVANYKYTFLPSMFITPLLKYTWNNYEHITKIPNDIKIIIIHGKNDNFITYDHGERLSKLRENIEFIVTEDDHNSVKHQIKKIVKINKS